jgi:hypothetical protein
MPSGQWGTQVDYMEKLNITKLLEISIPVMERFAAFELKPWDRKAVLLELLGEIGSLAHCIQYWDGFKIGNFKRSIMNDECSDVLFIIFRLAREDCITLPDEIEISETGNHRATDHVLELYALLSQLLEPDIENAERIMGAMIRILGSLSILLGVDLTESHKLEMKIANEYFDASGEHWPKLNPLLYPIRTFRIYRLIKKRGLQ